MIARRDEIRRSTIVCIDDAEIERLGHFPPKEPLLLIPVGLAEQAVALAKSTAIDARYPHLTAARQLRMKNLLRKFPFLRIAP